MFQRTCGLAGLSLRFGNVYGPHQDGTGEAGLVAMTSRRLLEGKPAMVRGDGLQSRDFVFVADVVEAILRALATDVTGPLNIGTGVATSVNRVVELLARAAGRPSSPVSIEPAAADGSCRWSEADLAQLQRHLTRCAPTS